MIPVEPEELSALIDGELDPPRAAEVELLIAADEDLRAALASLRELDTQWRAAAQMSVFVPRIRVAQPQRMKNWLPSLPIALGLAGARAALRLMDATVLAFVLQALVLAVLLAGTAWLCRRDLAGSERKIGGDEPSPPNPPSFLGGLI